MSLLWRKGKAALAVLLSLGLACSGPDTKVFAEAPESTAETVVLYEKESKLSQMLTTDDCISASMEDIARPLETPDEKASDGTEVPDGGVGKKAELVGSSMTEDGVPNEDMSEVESPTEVEGASGNQGMPGNEDEPEAPSENGDRTESETPSENENGVEAQEPSENEDEAGNDATSEGGDKAEDEVDAPDETDGDKEADGEESENSDEDGEDAVEGDEKSDEAVVSDKDAEEEYIEMWVELESPETSAMSWSLFSARTSPYVQLKDGNYEKWIDRIVIPESASYASALYNDFVEGADGDGYEDILIDDGVSDYILFSRNVGSKDAADELLNEVAAYVQAVFDAFDRDHPEVFWLNKPAIGYSGYYSDMKYYVRFGNIRKAGYDAATIKNDISLRESHIKAIQDSVSDSTDVGKIKGYNEWLTKNNEYNTIVSGSAGGTAWKMAWECTSALEGNEGVKGPVCEGYARAFKVLCDRANIPCVLVDGQAGESHMWNNVKVGDAWYAVDVTWDDPTGGQAGKVSGHENENWLLVGSETQIGTRGTFAGTHNVENLASVGGVNFTNGPVLSPERYVAKPNIKVSFAQSSESVVYSGSQAAVTAPTVEKEDGTAIGSPTITYSYRRNGDANFTDGRPVDVGTYEVKAKVAEGTDYAAGESSNTLTLTITQAPLTITAAPQTIESGDSISADVSKASADKLLGDDTLTGCELSVEGSYVNVGTYDITVKNAQITRDGMDVTGNYNISYAKGTMTVAQATITDKTNKNQSIAKGDGNFEAPFFVDKNGNKVSGSVSYIYGDEACSETDLISKLSKLGEGDTGKISYTFKPDSPNYKVPAQGTINFTIMSISFMMNNEKATLENTVTVKNASPVYGDTWEQVLSLNSGLVAKFKDGQDTDATHFTLNVSGTIGQVGSVTYRVQYSGTISGTSFQNVTVCEGTVNVQKAPLTITVNDHNITYGDAPSNNGVSYDGFKNDDDAISLSGTLSYSYGGYSAQSNAGVYVLSANGLFSDNYEITYKPGKLNVAKRSIDVKWQGADKVTYDGAEHEITADIADASSILNGDDVQITCTGNIGTSARTYNAVASVSNANYAISEATKSKTLIIEPKKLAFIWSGDTQYTYDGKEHGVTVTFDESSVVPGDKVEFTHEDTKGVDAGEYTARVISVSNPNYTIAGSATATKKWVIDRRDITGAIVVLKGSDFTYNATAQTKEVDSVTLTVEGTEKKLTAGTEYAVEGATNTNAGNYTLTVTGVNNYTGSVSVPYVINKSNVLINKPEDDDLTVKEPVKDLSGVKLPDGWVWENPNTELVPGGFTEVTAVVESKDNYDIPDAKDGDFYVTYKVPKNPELVTDATDTSYTIGVGNGATVKSTGALKEFKEVKVDGKVVDSSKYTLKEGSTILTFTKSYMDSLSVGKHTVELFYTVGSVAVDMTVAKKAEPSNPTPPTTPTAPETTTTTVDVTTTAANAAGAVLSPKTGQEDMTYMYWLIALAALAGAGVCAKAADRNRKSAR